jgi:plasmid maintenance system antidote protein VapI
VEAAGLSAALARLGVSAAELGRAVVPPVERSHISEMANGKRKIGKVMAARLSAAIKEVEKRGKPLP